MTPQDRMATSAEFARRSDQEFDNGGNELIAAELIWGAVAHNLLAMVDFHPGWRVSGHSYYAFAGGELEKEDPSKSWKSDVATADRLHRHFYNNNLSADDLARCRIVAKRLKQATDQYLMGQIFPSMTPPI